MPRKRSVFPTKVSTKTSGSHFVCPIQTGCKFKTHRYDVLKWHMVKCKLEKDAKDKVSAPAQLGLSTTATPEVSAPANLGNAIFKFTANENEPNVNKKDISDVSSTEEESRIFIFGHDVARQKIIRPSGEGSSTDINKLNNEPFQIDSEMPVKKTPLDLSIGVGSMKISELPFVDPNKSGVIEEDNLVKNSLFSCTREQIQFEEKCDSSISNKIPHNDPYPDSSSLGDKDEYSYEDGLSPADRLKDNKFPPENHEENIKQASIYNILKLHLLLPRPIKVTDEYDETKLILIREKLEDQDVKVKMTVFGTTKESLED